MSKLVSSQAYERCIVRVDKCLSAWRVPAGFIFGNK